jgi:hypothetical protein
MIIVVPTGSNPLATNRDHPVNNFVLIAGGNENNHIAQPD